MTTNCNNYAVKYRADQEAKKFNETYMALYNGMYDVRDGIVSVDEYADKIDAALKGGFPIDYRKPCGKALPFRVGMKAGN